MKTVTLLLRDWKAGDQRAFDQLMNLVYDELRRLAASYMRAERPGHTLRPTELVSEAYLRLAQGEQLELSDRAHFFGIVARMMRQILVDEARKRQASKRGGGERPITLDDIAVSTDRPAEVVALDEALSALAHIDERKAKTAELFFFCGHSQDEIATMHDVHVNTVIRDLRFAKAWVRRYLDEAN
ncbi:MAG TPA: ECF-type sigma factor [Polyangiaceae bacterium]|nr:ECF-type sigma factor [Polyangiaceae bacterium]